MADFTSDYNLRLPADNDTDWGSDMRASINQIEDGYLTWPGLKDIASGRIFRDEAALSGGATPTLADGAAWSTTGTNTITAFSNVEIGLVWNDAELEKIFSLAGAPDFP